MNRLLLQARLAERGAVRYTPAGLAALDLSLKHESEVSEDGQARKVSMEMKAVAIGAITQALLPLGLGSEALFGGFITSTRNGRGLLFHLTSVAPGSTPETDRNPSGLINFS
jgi:primosomal replication protein N